jgi:hypothetical protein
VLNLIDPQTGVPPIPVVINLPAAEDEEEADQAEQGSRPEETEEEQQGQAQLPHAQQPQRTRRRVGRRMKR